MIAQLLAQLDEINRGNWMVIDDGN